MKVNNIVFFVSACLVAIFVVVGAAFPEQTGDVFASVQDFIITTFGGFYAVSVAFFLLFVVFLLVSPYGRIRLGKDDDVPEYSRASWFAMLFSAGMGIGLLFFSVAEPIMHYSNPPTGEPLTHASAQQAMGITFYHWGLHAWAIYNCCRPCVSLLCSSPRIATNDPFDTLSIVRRPNPWAIWKHSGYRCRVRNAIRCRDFA